MSIQTLFKKLHNKQPKFAKKASLVTASSVITANSFLGGIPLWALGISKTVTGSKIADDNVIKIANYWINTNNKLIDTILPEKDWRISLPTDTDPNKKYLLICNHQSWVDTSVIQYVSQNRLPLTRFFTKYELIYLPFVGQAFYFLDFPMMKRHSKEAVKNNPTLRGKDIEEAKRACELLKNKPFTLLNYLEGTRFTRTKHKEQKSPYTHLLKPRAGGLALAISALGEDIDGILDMTIVYPDGVPTYQDLWQGNITKLGVDIKALEIPSDLFEQLKQGNYNKNEVTKKQMFEWLDTVWQQKDTLITKMLNDFSN